MLCEHLKNSQIRGIIRRSKSERGITMTELVKIMQQRHSCRKFLDKAVENEKIVACINAASLAPSAYNTQPYHFYVANTPETVAAAAKSVTAHNAKAIVIVTQEHADMPTTLGEAVRKDFRHFDIGLALENFLLEATELGLGTCILGSFNEEKLKSAFRIPSPKKIALVIAMGYSAEKEVAPKKRRPLEESITYLK